MWQWLLTDRGSVSAIAVRWRLPADMGTSSNGLGAWERSVHSGWKARVSYGAGLAPFLTRRGYTVVEVNRSDRSVRYRKGKSDPH